MISEKRVEEIRKAALRLDGPNDLDAVVQAAGDADFVLLGEASHGTSEFYTWRAELSKRLIAEKGFSFIAVEGRYDAFIYIDESHALSPLKQEVLHV